MPQAIQILHLFGLSRLLFHSVFWDIFLMRPTFPSLHYQQSDYLPSRFSPRLKHILGRFLVILSFRIDEFSLCLPARRYSTNAIAIFEMLILHKICQIPMNCPYESLLASATALETFVNSCPSPAKFWFLHG